MLLKYTCEIFKLFIIISRGKLPLTKFRDHPVPQLKNYNDRHTASTNIVNTLKNRGKFSC